jgi:hypothetical protein
MNDFCFMKSSLIITITTQTKQKKKHFMQLEPKLGSRLTKVKYHPMVELKIWMPNGFEILTMSLSHPTVRICSRLVRDCVLLPVAF